MNTRSDTIRCFIALYPDAAASEQIANFVSYMSGVNSTIKWEKSSQIHITMKFIGDIDRKTLMDIVQTLRTQIPDHPQVKGNIDKVGAFPNFRNPRILWLGFSEAMLQLAKLQRIIEEICEEKDIPKERGAFTPHFTIGRVKERSIVRDLDQSAASAGYQAVPVTFGDVRFMASTLTPAGAIHKEIARIPFV
jgi:2'-5' RNA ligase